MPVQYKLKPIDELFDHEKPTLREYFSPDVISMIKSKIKSISSEYCRLLEQSGTNVQCKDESVIKMRDHVFSCVTLDISKMTLDNCIQQCVQQKGCQAASFNEQGFINHFSCCICNYYTSRMAVSYYNGTTSFLDPSSLSEEFGLQELRYDLSVPRVNAMLITGSNDFETLNNFYALACSFDEHCVGFEVGVKTIYKHNCHMYWEHSEHLVPTAEHDFETYIMSSLAKENKKAQYDVWFSLNNVAVYDSMPIAATDCGSECERNEKCIGFSSIHESCRLIMTSHNSKNLALQMHDVSSIVFNLWRGEPTWLNFTYSNFTESFLWELAETLGATSVMFANDMSAEFCARRCVANVECLAALWEAPKACLIYHRNLHSTSAADLNTQNCEGDFRLMIPNLKVKIKEFRSSP